MLKLAAATVMTLVFALSASRPSAPAVEVASTNCRWECPDSGIQYTTPARCDEVCASECVKLFC